MRCFCPTRYDIIYPESKKRRKIMIRFIYGPNGSGKTTEILDLLAKDTQNGIKSFLIVPDQEVLQFERLTLSKLPRHSQFSLEILSFSRLYNRVCREYGGLSYSYITKPMRSLLMWKTLRELSGVLEHFDKKALSDPSSPDTFLCAINELKANGVSAADLELRADKLPHDSMLRHRMRDIALIYSCFDNFVAEKYSDSSDDLMRLCEILEKHDFFNGANVYVDSFTSFTAVQHKILRRIFKTAENSTVSIPLPSPNYSDVSTLGIEDSLKCLKNSASLFGGSKDIILRAPEGIRALPLKYLSENLWRMDADVKNAPLPDGHVICEVCDNPYAEAEAVCAHILELLRGGARCRDIALIVRDCEKYRGVLDTALEKGNIPYYISSKSELCSLPPIKLILSALRIKKYNWQKTDVISHIKTGLCNIDTRDANLFEEYVNTWNIHGEQFLVGSWNMNPDGFVPEISERGAQILASANKVRDALVRPLLKLFVMLDASACIPDTCRALYSYLEEISLEEKLGELAAKAAQRGDLKQAKELASIYGVILSSLADVAQMLEDEEADPEEFMLILKNIFDKTEIGTIPTSIDEVTIGSASMLRAANRKYVFALGLCEGEFPASVSDNGIFSAVDREMLASIGIELLGNNDIRSSDELMYVSRAFASAGEKLFVLTHKAELDGSARFPSLAFNRLKTLFGDALTLHEYKLSDLRYSIGAPKNAVTLLRSLEDEATKASLREALSKSIPSLATMSQKSPSTDKCSVSVSTMQDAIGRDLHMSSSSFEKYAKCPFDYFCSKVLNLRENIDSNFKASDIGSFIHYILEVLIKTAIPADPSEPMLSDDEIVVKASVVVEEYLQKICPLSMINSRRQRHLYTRLTNLATLLIKNTVKEFSQSQFRPAFFELKTNGKDANPAPLAFTLEDGSKLSFSGIIDRVDLYKKNGEVYVRIVDYKTGAKDFSLEDIEHGINMQMLIYLFTLCRNGSAQFKRALGVNDGKNALPAGVIYLSTAIPIIDSDGMCAPDEILRSAEDKLSRSGLLINDTEILIAMNEKLDSRFLAGIKLNKQNEPDGKALTSLEDFESIYQKLSDTVNKIASDLKAGIADAAPLTYKAQNPCEYCKSLPICRRINK